MRLRHIILLVCCILFVGTGTQFNAQAQVIDGVITERQVMSNLDTLVIKRWNGDFWFGPTAGMSMNGHFGDLFLPRGSYRLVPADTVYIGSGTGAGRFFGARIEWAPVGSDIALSANLVYDNRSSSVETQSPQGPILNYTSDLTLEYLVFSPEIDYKLSAIPGLRLTGGFDAELNLAAEAAFIPVRRDSGSITTEVRRVQIETEPFRIGVNAGVSYDIFLFEANQRTRFHFSPFVTGHFGTNVTNDFGSDWNMAVLRAGARLKIGPNATETEILPFDPTYKGKIVAIASLDKEFRVEPIELRPVPQLQALALEVPNLVVSEAETPIAIEDPEIPEIDLSKFDIHLGAPPEALSGYTSQLQISLPDEVREYLDALVAWTQDNPYTEIRIEGHTDNFGSRQEMQKISENRAKEVLNYLVSKGIPASRIFASGLGGRRPIADPRTPEGRRQNRRVEIMIVNTGG